MKTRFNPFETPSLRAETVRTPAPAPRRRTGKKKPRRPLSEKAAAALARAQEERSLANYPIIIAEFEARGIPADDIIPRENVLTFNAWLAKGRCVRKGEHGVKIATVLPFGETTDPETGETKLRTRPWSATVFHISQTDEIRKAVPVQVKAPEPAPIKVNFTPPTIPMPVPVALAPSANPPRSWRDKYRLAKSAA